MRNGTARKREGKIDEKRKDAHGRLLANVPLLSPHLDLRRSIMWRPLERYIRAGETVSWIWIELVERRGALSFKGLGSMCARGESTNGASAQLRALFLCHFFWPPHTEGQRGTLHFETDYPFLLRGSSSISQAKGVPFCSGQNPLPTHSFSPLHSKKNGPLLWRATPLPNLGHAKDLTECAIDRTVQVYWPPIFAFAFRYIFGGKDPFLTH